MSQGQECDLTLAAVQWRPPLMTTERLILRGWQPADADAVFRYASDPDVAKYMSWDRHRDIDDTHCFFNDFVADQYEQHQLEYAVCERANPELAIGGVGLYWRSREDRVMEIGYVLAKEYWGRGYVPEAARSLLRHAVATTNVYRIYAPIFADNVKSRRAAEKMGFQLDGVLRSALERRGRRWDEAIYSILRHELLL